jgi:hypothetical protein
MGYTQISLTHSRDGFSLFREDRSHFKDWVSEKADSLCEATGHRWCHIYGRVWDWADKGALTDKRVAISDETAFALSDDKDWEWVREDNDNAS